jgi:hypothetical protein
MRFSLLLVLVALGADRVRAQDKTAAPLIVIDAKGKEIQLKSWKFTYGTMRLWVADGKSAPAPECLVFREDKSTTYQNGIATLVPLASIRVIDYDNGKKAVAVTLLNSEGKEETLRGSTKFKDINKLTLEAEAELDGLGVAAVKFHGGALADGIRGLRWTKPEPVSPFPAERTASITAVDKQKHTILDPVAVYRLGDGTLRAAPTLFFKATVKVDLAKITRLKHVEPDNAKQPSHDFKIIFADGAQHTLTLLTKVELDAKKAANLMGLAGRVSAGYKLFPPHTIADASFEASNRAR